MDRIDYGARPGARLAPQRVCYYSSTVLSQTSPDQVGVEFNLVKSQLGNRGQMSSGRQLSFAFEDLEDGRKNLISYFFAVILVDNIFSPFIRRGRRGHPQEAHCLNSCA